MIPEWSRLGHVQNSHKTTICVLIKAQNKNQQKINENAFAWYWYRFCNVFKRFQDPGLLLSPSPGFSKMYKWIFTWDHNPNVFGRQKSLMLTWKCVLLWSQGGRCTDACQLPHTRSRPTESESTILTCAGTLKPEGTRCIQSKLGAHRTAHLRSCPKGCSSLPHVSFGSVPAVLHFSPISSNNWLILGYL